MNSLRNQTLLEEVLTCLFENQGLVSLWDGMNELDRLTIRSKIIACIEYFGKEADRLAVSRVLQSFQEEIVNKHGLAPKVEYIPDQTDSLRIAIESWQQKMAAGAINFDLP